MDKLIFDKSEFNTIPFGAHAEGNSARFSLIKPKRKTVPAIIKAVTGINSIRLETNRGKLIAQYDGYTEFSYEEVIEDYVMPKDNPDSPDVTVTVVEVHLRKPTNVEEPAEEE